MIVAPVITGTAELVMVMSEVAVLESALSWAETVRLTDPADGSAVNVTDGVDGEERFPKDLFRIQS